MGSFERNETNMPLTHLPHTCRISPKNTANSVNSTDYKVKFDSGLQAMNSTKKAIEKFMIALIRAIVAYASCVHLRWQCSR